MDFLYSFLFIIIIGGALGILYIYQYNKIQHAKTKIDQAECLIDEILRNKYDLLVNLERVLKTVLDTNKTFFKDLVELKDSNISNFDLDRKLTEYCNLLFQIKLDNPSLGEIKEFKELNSSLKKIDEKLQADKSYYNKYTSELNDLIRSFPSNVVARMHKIDIKPFFDGKNMHDEIIDDFKL